MKAGLLNQRVYVERDQITGQNTAGEDTKSQSQYGPLWAEIRSLHGRELEMAQQLWAEASFKIRLRYMTWLTIETTDRITWNGRTLEILSAEDPDGRRREILIYLKEVK